MTDRETQRWVGVSALAFGAAAMGVVFRQPAVMLVAAVGVAYAAYARAATTPAVSVDLTREIDADDPSPGDEVPVTLSVENTGGATLSDLRLVDGVPELLEVVGGSARLGTALRPGESASTTYRVEARRGVHEFEPIRVIARDWSGAVERDLERETPGELRCVPELEALGSFPLRTQASEYAGNVTTDTGGSGLEFHSTRQYRHGDPLARIDWSRLAKTGDLTTVQFREERAAETVVVVDIRAACHVADADNESAIDHGVRAAGQVASALLETSNRVGLAAFGPAWTWVAPRLGRTHRVKLRETLATDPAFYPLHTQEQFLPLVVFERLRGRLPSDAQVVFVSPAVDNYATVVARRLEAYGYAVTLLSPDVTDGTTAGAVLSALERRERLAEARSAGIRVIDWNPDVPLAVALGNAQRGWQR